jgi:Uncharacterized protein conserved in bacteria (DUF2252)
VVQNVWTSLRRTEPVTRPCARGSSAARFVALLCAAGTSLLLGASPVPPQSPPQESLAPEPVRLTRVTPTLLGKLKEDAFAYFRFINRRWATYVCQAFTEEIREMPVVRLHGDAHIEQYALTATEYGLDDFDDSASGPSVIDLVRFLGSVDLAMRELGWEAHVDAAFDQFLDGYRSGLRDPRYVAPVPAIVTRLRREPQRSQAEFLDWADSLMQPLTEQQERIAHQDIRRLATLLHDAHPEISVHYFDIIRVGSIRMGVGSALTEKVLLRLRGRTSAPIDDVILEAKALNTLIGIPCLELPPRSEVARIIDGAEQIGRLRHEVLAKVPVATDVGPRRQWWVRSWEPTYRELVLSDLQTPEDLKQVALDVGSQLGAANLKEASAVRQAAMRRKELAMLDRMEPKIRRVVREMVDRMLQDWATFSIVKPPQ